jgi:hypothetical protein
MRAGWLTSARAPGYPGTIRHAPWPDDPVTDSWKDRTTIASPDLDVLARLTAARFADRAQEARRLAQLDDVNGAVAALSRSLAALGRHAISECRGSHSKWDVMEDSRAFYEALSTYATLVRELADEYRSLSADTAVASSESGRRRNLSII